MASEPKTLQQAVVHFANPDNCLSFLMERRAEWKDGVICPACGSKRIRWGCDPAEMRGRAEIHPLVWHETHWMADSFVCLECEAGWIEPDDPEPITWVRPYWVR